MKRFKGHISILLCFCLIVSVLSGCSSTTGGAADNEKLTSLEQAFAKLNDEDYKAAAELFEGVLADDEQNTDVIVALSEAYIGMSAYEDAENLLRAALDDNKTDKELWDALIAVYKAADKSAEERAELLHAAYSATGSERYNEGQSSDADDEQNTQLADAEKTQSAAVKTTDSASDGVIEVVLSRDNLVAKDEASGVSVKFSAIDIEADTTFTMEPVKSSLSEAEMGDDVKATAYNFEYGGESLFDLVEITVPFDKSFIDEGADVVNSVAAAYYNEGAERYEPVMYEVDAAAGTVKIYTEHFSKYEVFTFKNPKTRRTKATLSEAGVVINLSTMRDKSYDRVLEEFVTNGGEPDNLALEYGVQVGNDFLAFGGNTFTLLTETNALTPSKPFKALSNIMTEVGMAMAIYQATVDYQKGDRAALASNATKNISYYAVGKWGSSISKLASVGVFAIDYSLNQFATVAWEEREKMYAKAYKLYYERKHKALGDRENAYFRKKLWRAYKDNLKNEGDRKAFKAIIDEMIDEYVNEFWQEDVDVGFYFTEANKGANFAVGGGIGDEMKARISKNAKYDLVKALQPVFTVINRKIKYASFDDLMVKMRELETVLNSVYSVEISESKADEAAEFEYKKAACIFAPLADGVEPKKWGIRLDDNARGRIRFRLVGYLQSGMPDKINVYKQGVDYKTGDPDLVVDFELKESPIKVTLDQRVPTLDQLVGVWGDSTKNSIMVSKVDVPWEDMKAAIVEYNNKKAAAENSDEAFEQCDFEVSPEDVDETRVSVEQIVGVALPMTFEIIKTGETNGQIKFLSFPGNEGGQCDDVVGQTLDFSYNDGKLTMIVDESKIDASLPIGDREDSVTSSVGVKFVEQPDKSVVIALGGDITSEQKMSEFDYVFNIAITISLKGEKLLEKPKAAE